jgi:hypothetical protein
MRRKRLIWFTFILIVCVFGGGLYYSVSRPPFLCPISTVEDAWQDRLRLWFSYKFITSGLTQAAQKYNEDMSEWDHVDVYYDEGIWLCFVDMKSNRKESILVIMPRDSEPELQKHRWSEPPRTIR